MKKLSLAKRIENYIRKKFPNYVHSGDIEILAIGAGYKASNATRRCREMASGINSTGGNCPIVLERKEEKGSVLYRYIQPQIINEYYVPDLNKTIPIYEKR